MSLLENNGRGALVSDCERYRYRLWRIWDDLAPLMVWIMLNPSTADAAQDDPTIRKCIGFARAHHHGGIIVVNLFAHRSPSPKDLYDSPYCVGLENDEHIQWAVRSPILATVVGGWGTQAKWFIQRRAEKVRLAVQSQRRLHCFGKTVDGSPRHPLYLPYSKPLTELTR